MHSKSKFRIVSASVLPYILDQLSQQLQSFRIVAFALQEKSQVASCEGIAFEFAVESDRLAQHRFGIRIPVLEVKAFAELRKTLGDGNVMFTEISLANGKRLPVKRFSPLVLALLPDRNR